MKLLHRILGGRSGDEGLTSGRKEFLEIVDAVKERAESAVAEENTTGLITVDYCGVEVLCDSILGRFTAPVEPLLYLGGGVGDDGVNISFARFTPEEAEKVTRLFRSADPTQVESRFHFIHPLLAHPQIRGQNWSTWKLGGESLIERFGYQRDTIELAVRKSEPYLSDDANVLFLACGMGFDIRVFCGLFRKEFPNMNITGIDFNESLLITARTLLQGHDVKLIQDNLHNLSNHFGMGEVDLAIGVGLFDTQTLEWNEGLDILNQIQHVLAEGGHAISKSYGAQLYDRALYQQHGLPAKACSHPELLFSGKRADVYVVENRPHGKAGGKTVNTLHEESDQWKQHPPLLDKVSVSIHNATPFSPPPPQRT